MKKQNKIVCVDDTYNIGVGFLGMTNKKTKDPNLTKNKLYEYEPNSLLEAFGLVKVKDNSKTFSIYSMKRFAFVDY